MEQIEENESEIFESENEESDNETNEPDVSLENENEENNNQEENKKSKRGRKPKPKTDDPKIPKKRGRKPKPMEVVDIKENMAKLPKKRGRRKKCDIDSMSKISGFCATGDSIDTKNNKITFAANNNTEDTIENEIEQISEKISFGKFNIGIQTIHAADAKEIITNIHKNSNSDSRQSLCNIDLPDYESDTEDEEENEEQYEEENIQSENLKVKKTESSNEKTKDRFKINPDLDISFVLEQYKGKNNEKINWPQKTDIACWWCCHKFDWTPNPLPYAYDEVKNRFKVMGIFCSWNCAKSYSMDDTTLTSNYRVANLTTMIQQIYGRYIDIPCAPPRQALKMFGGKMSISEFRNIHKNDYFEINKANMILDSNIYIVRSRKKK